MPSNGQGRWTVQRFSQAFARPSGGAERHKQAMSGLWPNMLLRRASAADLPQALPREGLQHTDALPLLRIGSLALLLT